MADGDLADMEALIRAARKTDVHIPPLGDPAWWVQTLDPAKFGSASFERLVRRD
jgi:hypothetical protein